MAEVQFFTKILIRMYKETAPTTSSVYPVQLSDPDGNPIACTAINGTVEVIPEFSRFLIIPLIVVTLVVVTLKMKHTQRNN